MKNKRIFEVGLVLALVSIFGIGFFFNSKSTKKDVEVDLSVAAAVVETYIEEKYEISPLAISTEFDNQTKKITIYSFEPGVHDDASTCTKEEYKEVIGNISELNLDAKEVVSKLLDRNDINVSIKILNDYNTDRYLIEIVNGKVEYSFR